MASVLYSLGIKKQLPYTPISQLGVNSDLNKLQSASEAYFTVEKGAQAADGNMLAVSIKRGQNFQTTNQYHIQFLNQCIAAVKEKSTQLKSIDQKIMGSVAFGVAATALSFLPVIGFLGWIG